MLAYSSRVSRRRLTRSPSADCRRASASASWPVIHSATRATSAGLGRGFPLGGMSPLLTRFMTSSQWAMTFGEP